MADELHTKTEALRRKTEPQAVWPQDAAVRRTYPPREGSYFAPWQTQPQVSEDLLPSHDVQGQPAPSRPARADVDTPAGRQRVSVGDRVKGGEVVAVDPKKGIQLRSAEGKLQWTGIQPKESTAPVRADYDPADTGVELDAAKLEAVKDYFKNVTSFDPLLGLGDIQDRLASLESDALSTLANKFGGLIPPEAKHKVDEADNYQQTYIYPHVSENDISKAAMIDFEASTGDDYVDDYEGTGKRLYSVTNDEGAPRTFLVTVDEEGNPVEAINTTGLHNSDKEE